MKKKPVKITKPKMRPLAKTLFEVGMDAWVKVEPSKTYGNYDNFCPGQVAAWNAIAKHVDKLIRSSF